MLRIPLPWEADQSPRRQLASEDVPRPPPEEIAAALPGAELAQVRETRPGRNRASAQATTEHLHRWHREHGDPLSRDEVHARVTSTLARNDRDSR